MYCMSTLRKRIVLTCRCTNISPYHNCDFWSSFLCWYFLVLWKSFSLRSEQHANKGGRSVSTSTFNVCHHHNNNWHCSDWTGHSCCWIIWNILVCCTMFLRFQVRIISHNFTSFCIILSNLSKNTVHSVLRITLISCICCFCCAEAEFYQQRLRSLQGLRVPLATTVRLPLAIALRV